MAFTNDLSVKKGQIGEVNYSFNPKIDAVTFDYNSPLKIGRIAQYKDGVLCDLDATATPIIAGVVVRNIANAIENGDTFTTNGDGAVIQVEVLSFGLINVAVKDGDTPSKFGKIYAVISGDDAGKVTTDSTALEVKGYFNRPVETGIWEVFIQL